ncbi:hypothetical protein FOZ63_002427 [Perkinsus olseni]|uniref:Uncharacterized protein n=1 Tax=Perkinsus olseni TaxID=32597 RepID=A0A7J6SUF3_PEROL|nr:hypothetical protein FOZ63_002427 [Perkinsus olseni]
MKLSTYLLGYLTISQLTNGVVLQQESGSSDSLDTQRALDQGNKVSSGDGIMSGIAYPANQPYGPALPDGTCPTIDGVKQFPAKYWKDHHYLVCMPYNKFKCACPPAPTKFKPHCDGPDNMCPIPCDKDSDCQEGAICFNPIPLKPKAPRLCVFNTTPTL